MPEYRFFSATVRVATASQSLIRSSVTALPVIAVVGNDAGWTQIAREQKKLLGDDIGVVLARSAYHEVAAGFGAEGLLLKTSRNVSGVLARARATAKSGKPVLINAWLDPTDFREGSILM